MNKDIQYWMDSWLEEIRKADYDRAEREFVDKVNRDLERRLGESFFRDFYVCYDGNLKWVIRPALRSSMLGDEEGFKQ